MIIKLGYVPQRTSVTSGVVVVGVKNPVHCIQEEQAAVGVAPGAAIPVHGAIKNHVRKGMTILI
jgi:hypothetical protein